MTLSDLKNGMVVKLRDNSTFLVLEMCGNKFLIDKNFLQPTEYYSHNMREVRGFVELDIVEVYEGCIGCLDDILNIKNKKLIWKRNEKKKMTIAEIEKELGYEIEIVKG